MRKRSTEPTRAERNERFQGIAAAAKAFSAFRPAHEVLRVVRSVPTRFIQFDHGTGVGGLPIDRFMLIHGPSGEGKAQPIDEPVLTPSGWCPIGELALGDHVIGSDGCPTKVLGVFPQGRKPVVRVCLDDGASARCCEEHLWLTTTTAELNRGRYVRGPRPGRERTLTGVEGNGSVKTTAEIRASLDAVHYLAYVRPVKFSADMALPMDPYVLGVLLGDGCFRGVGTVTLSSRDEEIFQTVGGWLYTNFGDRIVVDYPEPRCPVMRITGGEQGKSDGSRTRQVLADLGLMGTKSDTKFVPAAYLFASVDERLALLRGLLDTDGHVSKGTKAEYSTTSPRLRDAVVFLTRSLGGRATVGFKETGYLPAWRVSVTFGDGTNPFGMGRKAFAWRSERQLQNRRRIVQIEDVGEAECVCIKVAASDSLYVTKDFILTHNTYFSLGLLDSFLQRDHLAMLVDAERTTPITWARNIMKHADHPGFFAVRPNTYEETVDTVRKFLLTVQEQRAKKILPPDTSALVIVDSLKKLVPSNIWTKIINDVSKNGIDGVGGAAGRLKAAMNAQWMDELTPLLEETGTALVAIAREREDPDADKWAKMAKRDYKVQGGTAVYYDSSMAMRVERASWVQDKTGEGSDTVTNVFGERHRVTIRKTKVAGHEEKQTQCYFHTSNGKITPAGFDRARDVIELGIRFEVVEKSGAWFSYDGERLGQGIHNAVKTLSGDPDRLDAIEMAVREAFKSIAPVEFDGETGEIE